VSCNKYGEYILCENLMHSRSYYISRDKAGYHVLREGSPDGKELFSPVNDSGKKNTKKGRVIDVNLLEALMI